MTTSKNAVGGKHTKRRGHKKHHKRMRGGKGASEWQMANVGTENQQYNNVFVKGGPFGAAVQNLAGTQPSLVAGAFPSAGQLNLIQSAGSRKSHGKRTKRGGYWGSVISKALVPFTLLFAQNRLGKTRKQRK